jgi:Domain of unknown function (DUF4352)
VKKQFLGAIILIIALLLMTSCTSTQGTGTVSPVQTSSTNTGIVGHITTTTASTSKSVVTILYTATAVSQIGTGDFADTPKSGDEYLIFDMTIENQGYDSFSVNPFYFSLIANNVKYSNAFVSNLDNELNSVDVLNNGKIEGQLAFEVPATTGNFSLEYDGFETYNINWVQQ